MRKEESENVLLYFNYKVRGFKIMKQDFNQREFGWDTKTFFDEKVVNHQKMLFYFPNEVRDFK